MDLLLARNLKSVFELFHLYPSRFYPLTIMHRNALNNNYYLLYTLQNFAVINYEFIDFKIIDMGSGSKSLMKFDSEEKYREWYKTNGAFTRV